MKPIMLGVNTAKLTLMRDMAPSISLRRESSLGMHTTPPTIRVVRISTRLASNV